MWQKQQFIEFEYESVQVVLCYKPDEIKPCLEVEYLKFG